MNQKSVNRKSDIVIRLMEVERQSLISYQPRNYAELAPPKTQSNKIKNKRGSDKNLDNQEYDGHVSDRMNDKAKKDESKMGDMSTQTGPSKSNQVK